LIERLSQHMPVEVIAFYGERSEKFGWRKETIT
jgi:hypothetical protein